MESNLEEFLPEEYQSKIIESDIKESIQQSRIPKYKLYPKYEYTDWYLESIYD